MKQERATEWLVLSALVPPPGEEFLMVDALRRLGARAIERDGGRVVAWLPAPEDPADLVDQAVVALRSSTSMVDPAVKWHRCGADEWAARWGGDAAPRRVSDRIVVAPIVAGSSSTDPVDREDVVIRLETGPAFGTAEHATTRACLRLLDRTVKGGERVVDIGTGSGVLAIGAALLGAQNVLALEADALSCGSARRNALASAVPDRVHVRQLTVAPADLHGLAPADLVLANIEAAVLLPLLPGMAGILAPAGRLIVAGVTLGERPSLTAAAAAAGLEEVAREDIDGWLAITFAPAYTTRPTTR